MITIEQINNFSLFILTPPYKTNYGSFYVPCIVLFSLIYIILTRLHLITYFKYFSMSVFNFSICCNVFSCWS
ncbi:hypothetical protein [Staphylococcus phage PT1-4]